MAEDSSDKPKEDDTSDVTEIKDKSFGENVRELAGDLAKHSDRDTASNDDKYNQELKAEKAEVAELEVSTEANERQLTKFINIHGFIYTNSMPPIATVDQWKNSA